VVSRSAELRAVAEFLVAAGGQPSCLVVEGEAGIGKTALWLAAIEQAHERGFRVLSARVAQAESMLAYAAVTDVLSQVESAVFAGLSDLQRLAVDRVLLRASGEGPTTDQRVVGVAVLSVVELLAAQTPVLVAIDDVQWLDPSSKAVVAFAARRLKGRVGLLLTERSEPDVETTASWLQSARPDGVERIRVRPLSLGGLHTLFSERLGRSFPRPTMVRIGEISGGNPFYALELAHAIEGRSLDVEAALPATLADLVRARIGHLDGDLGDVLLATACVADATVDHLAEATRNTVEHTIQLLEEPETNGIITIDGKRVWFSHPLLATGVSAQAGPERRQEMHRALALVEAHPALKARHLALSTASGDPETLDALDVAADVAEGRGAPAAAAELLDMAIRLGGDTPIRRIRSAGYHYRAGDTEQAHAVLEPAIGRLGPGTLRALAMNLLAGLFIHDNAFIEAAEVLNRGLDDAKGNRRVLVQTLLLLSFVQELVGEYDESSRHAREAGRLADELDVPALTSQALAVWVYVACLQGYGVDAVSLRRALELEDPDNDVPIPLRASAINAQILAWTGRLEEADTQMEAVRRRCLERGDEHYMMFVSRHGALIKTWRGHFADAELIADDAMERAEQVAGDHIRVVAMTVRALVTAYTGRERDARAYAHEALDSAKRCRSPRLADWPTTSLGFLEVSLGNYAAALPILRPLVSSVRKIGGTEIFTAAFIPDAVEAMTALGHLDDAEPLTTALERNGRRLDRSWMLAVGARCRAMLLAAQGDVEAADRMAHQAMTEHERLPMPFERARTQLLLGQLQRRQRKKEAATATLREALHTFEQIGTPLWANRTRAELARTNVSPSTDPGLTPTEQRVAELAASGMTNREVAAALFISPKTVEHNLSRVYRKLGIRSRAELGQRRDQLSGRETPDSPDAPGG
jgi:ATP/maltotriose-dependent transcriptional regulator MalT